MRRAYRPLPCVGAVSLAALGWALASHTASAADWPHLRGPRYDGVSAETGLVESWPQGGPPVLWKIELGQGYSALIAVGDGVYTQYQRPSGQYLVCLDANTGRRIWRRR